LSRRTVEAGGRLAVALLCLLALTACRSAAPVLGGGTALTAALAATPAGGDAPLVVTFDAGGSSGGTAPLHYDYDFNGDGTYETTQAGPSVHWTYPAAGTFTARVLVLDALGQSATAVTTISVSASGNSLPVAGLALQPGTGSAPLNVLLDGSASSDSDGSLVRYDYDVNADGIWDAYDAGPAVHWNFTQPGDYSVRLRVTDNQGGQSSIERQLHVNAVPQAVIDASATTAQAGSTITFSAAGSSDADGMIVKYEWDADGNGSFELNKGSDPVLQILFPTVGTFTVRLRVTDDDGVTSTKDISIQITS
jgi:PKD repeat protein